MIPFVFALHLSMTVMIVRRERRLYFVLILIWEGKKSAPSLNCANRLYLEERSSRHGSCDNKSHGKKSYIRRCLKSTKLKTGEGMLNHVQSVSFKRVRLINTTHNFPPVVLILSMRSSLYQVFVHPECYLDLPELWPARHEDILFTLYRTCKRTGL